MAYTIPDTGKEDVSGGPLAAAIVGFVVSLLFLAGRLASRRIKRHPFDASDYTLLFGMICGWGVFASVIYGVKRGGLGRHIGALALADPTLTAPQESLKALVVVECLTTISLGTIKISFLLLYRSIFPSKSFRILTNIIGTILVIWMIVTSWVAVFACNPVQAFWTLSLFKKAKCINKAAFFMGTSIVDIVTDLILLSLPQSKIWKLQVRLRDKFELAFVFLLGSFVLIGGVVRLIFVTQVDFFDFTFSFTNLGIWTCLEPMIAVVSASMPLMRPLLQPHAMKKLAGSAKSHNRDSGGSSMDFLNFKRSGRRGPGDDFGYLSSGRNGSYAMGCTARQPELVELGKNFEWNGILVTKTWGTDIET